MDKRIKVIIAVTIIEIFFRIFSPYVPTNGLAYTLAARLTEMAVILGMGYDYCGVKTSSFLKELCLGILISIGFATFVIISEAVSHIIITKGLLGILLTKQPIENWPLFLLTGCIVGPFVEELFFRGLIYEWLRQEVKPLFCIIFTSLLFASMHGGFSVIQLTGGLLFATIYEWRRNIWAPFTLHALANIGIWVVPYIYPF